MIGPVSPSRRILYTLDVDGNIVESVETIKQKVERLKREAGETDRALDKMGKVGEKSAKMMGGAFGPLAEIIGELGGSIGELSPAIGGAGVAMGAGATAAAAMGYGIVKLGGAAFDATKRLLDMGLAGEIPAASIASMNAYEAATTGLARSWDLFLASFGGPAMQWVADSANFIVGLQTAASNLSTSGVLDTAGEAWKRFTTRLGEGNFDNPLSILGELGVEAGAGASEELAAAAEKHAAAKELAADMLLVVQSEVAAEKEARAKAATEAAAAAAKAASEELAAVKKHGEERLKALSDLAKEEADEAARTRAAMLAAVETDLAKQLAAQERSASMAQTLASAAAQPQAPKGSGSATGGVLEVGSGLVQAFGPKAAGVVAGAGSAGAASGAIGSLGSAGPVGAIIAIVAALPDLLDKLISINESLLEMADQWPDKLKKAMTEGLPKLIAETGPALAGKIVEAFVQLPFILYEAMPKIILAVFQSIGNSVKEIFEGILKGLAPLTDKQGRFLGTDFKAEGGRSLFGIELPSFDRGTSEITRTGLATVHKGEEIRRAGQSPRGMPGGSPTFNIHGGDTRETIRQIREVLGGSYGPGYGTGEVWP
jgi:hypothetical protein